MTILQSPIQFGDYIMPIGTVLKSQQLDSTVEDTPLLGLHGSYAPPGYATGAVITIQIEMGGGGDVSPTTSNPLLTLDDANNEANQLYLRLQEGYQQLKVGTTPARYIMAQKRKFSVQPLEGSGRTHLGITIEFFAQDPRWLSVTNNSSAIAGPPGGTNITNAGTARSYPVFTLTSGGATPEVDIIPPGLSAVVSVKLNYTMTGGDTIIINTDPRNRANAVLLNGAPRLDLLGTTGLINNIGTGDLFPFLDPGISKVTVVNASCTMTWHDTWGL